jgi:Tetratricopeptide repeat
VPGRRPRPRTTDAADRLASSLNDLSVRLGDLGGGRRRWPRSRRPPRLPGAGRGPPPDAFRPAQATSLNNLSNRLGDLGRREEALVASARRPREIY